MNVVFITLLRVCDQQVCETRYRAKVGQAMGFREINQRQHNLAEILERNNEQTDCTPGPRISPDSNLLHLTSPTARPAVLLSFPTSAPSAPTAAPATTTPSTATTPPAPTTALLAAPIPCSLSPGGIRCYSDPRQDVAPCPTRCEGHMGVRAARQHLVGPQPAFLQLQHHSTLGCC